MQNSLKDIDSMIFDLDGTLWGFDERDCFFMEYYNK